MQYAVRKYVFFNIHLHFSLVTGHHNIHGILLPHSPSALSQMKVGTFAYQNIQVNWCVSYKITVYFKLFPKTTFFWLVKKSCYKYLHHLLCHIIIFCNIRDKKKNDITGSAEYVTLANNLFCVFFVYQLQYLNSPKTIALMNSVTKWKWLGVRNRSKRPLWF